MYDGSTGTNASATPAAANGLFNSGIAAAGNYNAANSTFLALYGMEWGVISNGGHLNIVNPDALAGWETNGSGQLLGTVNTPKSDYATLYAAAGSVSSTIRLRRSSRLAAPAWPTTPTVQKSWCSPRS